MKRNLLITSLVLIILMSMQFMVLAQSIGDYLILQDIGIYKLDKPEKHLPGEPHSGGPRTYDKIGASGIDHFPDHVDKNYVVMYLGGDANASPTVQVTKHSGSDSDKWLMHELERSFRDADKLEASPLEDTMMREINGNKIFFYGGGVVGYRWINNYIVVNIQYTNLSGPKSEPLDVVKAYLAKFPSTITLSDTDMKSRSHSELWIKDEMDRRLWLCDKWFMQLQLKKAQQTQVLQESVKSMNVFLDYREKYYGIKAAAEKNLLAGYLNTNNGTAIKVKLTEYKKWWGIHKTDAISL